MSIEQQIEALTAAINANTQALLGNAGTAPIQTTDTVQPIQPVTPVQNAVMVPAQTAAAPVTPAAAAIPAAGSPSNVIPLTIEQLQQEVTAKYQASTPEVQAQIGAIVQQFGSLTAVPADQISNVLTAVRAL